MNRERKNRRLAAQVPARQSGKPDGGEEHEMADTTRLPALRPELQERVERKARRMAGPDADELTIEVARRIVRNEIEGRIAFHRHLDANVVT